MNWQLQFQLGSKVLEMLYIDVLKASIHHIKIPFQQTFSPEIQSTKYVLQKTKIWPLHLVLKIHQQWMGPNWFPIGESSRLDTSHQLSLNLPKKDVDLQLPKSHAGVSICVHIHTNDTMTRLYILRIVIIVSLARNAAKADSRIHSRCKGISH